MRKTSFFFLCHNVKVIMQIRPDYKPSNESLAAIVPKTYVAVIIYIPVRAIQDASVLLVCNGQIHKIG